MSTASLERPLPAGRGRRRFNAIGQLLRLVKALPTPLRKRGLDVLLGGVPSNLPPFPDGQRPVEAPQGVPDSTRWTISGHSATTNLGKDMLTRSQLLQEAACFAGDRDLDDPSLSALFGSFPGFPRISIPVGTKDVLLDDARRVAAAMLSDGVDVTLDEWPGAVHGFTNLPLAEGRQYRHRLRTFLDTTLGVPTSPPNTRDADSTTEGKKP